MKILILSSSDSRGGAAKGAHRLFEALLEQGAHAHMAVQLAHSGDVRVLSKTAPWSKLNARLRPKFDSLISKPYHPKRIFSTSLIPFSSFTQYIESLAPDLVNLHWVNGGFLDLRAMDKITVPIAWNLHDSWPFTGGCHLPLDCTKFQNTCGACPTLNSTREDDLSRKVFNIKSVQYPKLRIAYSAPSRWMKDQAAASSLLGSRLGRVIPNAIDPDLYTKTTKMDARKLLNLPLDRKIIAFGAMDAFQDDIKGSAFVKQLLPLLNPEFHFCFFGTDSVELPIALDRCHFLGTIHDDYAMATVFKAADTLVVPSKTESFSYVTLEALCAGTPVAAFGLGGLLDLIEPGKNGYLARPFDVADLANSVESCIKLSDFHFNPDRFRYSAVAKAHMEFFNEVCTDASDVLK